MMIHDFDMVNFLFEGLPKSIMVSASSVIDKKISELGDYDTAVATLKYADGRLVVIKNSRRAAYGYDQRIEILGSKGLLQVQNVVEDGIINSSLSSSLFFFSSLMDSSSLQNMFQQIDELQS